MGYDYDESLEGTISSLSKAFHVHDEYELIGGVDDDSSKRELFSKKYTHAFSDINSLLAYDKPDVVAVSVPTNSHLKVVEELVEKHRPKAILSEKPLAYDLKDAVKIYELTRDKGIHLFVNYTRISNPVIKDLKEKIKKAKFSSPIKGVCWYSKGLFHNGSHFLNLFQYWLGNVKSYKILNFHGHIQETDFEVDVEIEFELGKVLFLSTGQTETSFNTVELISKNGRLRYEANHIKLAEISDDVNKKDYIIMNDIEKDISFDMQRPQWHVVDKINEYLSGNLDASICHGVDALETIKIIEKITRIL